ncbi:MAG: hypothetical protein OXL96_05030 [Candidatus Poribacteria bacterium]|nr:hypothetical protein [Candidatus Poribacteria bacterium]
MLDKIVAMLGASPTQYRHLLKTEKLVEKRALEGKRFVNLSLGLTCLFCFVMSIPITFMMLLPISVFMYAVMGITMSMFMVGIWTIPYFDILLSPINYPIVAHTPVSSRTYFLVKLTKIFTYTVLLLVSSGLLPAIGGIWLRGGEAAGFRFLFPLVYLPIVFISGFFMIAVMTTFAGYLTKLYSKKSLRNIAQYAQFIFPMLFPVMLILLPRLLPEDITFDKLTSTLKWFYVLPNGWFASAVSVALGETDSLSFTLAGLAVASTLILVLLPLRSIAKSYSQYLSYLLESGSRQKSGLQVKTPLLARMFRNHAIRAGLCLSTAYLCRDKRILQQFFIALGSMLVIIVISTQDGLFFLKWKWIQNSYAIGLSPGFSIMFCFVGMAFVDSFIVPVRYSEHWKAAWVLKLAPFIESSDLWRGVQATTLFYLVAPCTLLVLCVAIVIWGVLGIFYVLPGFIVLLNYVIFYPKSQSGLPLAEEFVQKRTAAAVWLPFICNLLAIGIFIGIQFLTYLLNIWVYYSFYCVTVVGGLIGFMYFWTRKRTKEIANA